MFLPALPPTSSCNLSLVCVRRLQGVMSNRVVQHMCTVQHSTTVSVKSVTLSFVPSKQRHSFRFMRAFAWWGCWKPRKTASVAGLRVWWRDAGTTNNGRDIRNRARRHSQQEKSIHDVIRQFVVRREICSANHPLVPPNVTCFFERDENVTAADLRVHIPPQPVNELLHTSSAEKNAPDPSETLVHSYQTTWRHIPEDKSVCVRSEVGNFGQMFPNSDVQCRWSIMSVKITFASHSWLAWRLYTVSVNTQRLHSHPLICKLYTEYSLSQKHVIVSPEVASTVETHIVVFSVTSHGLVLGLLVVARNLLLRLWHVPPKRR